MSIPAGPKLDFIEASETTISLQFQPLSSIDRYEVQWKLVEHEWSNPAGSTNATASGKSSNVRAEAAELTPGMTYCIRACCIDPSGAKGVPGPELIIDTEQVGCTPKADKSCCTIQ
ncbi:fibronectin type III domain containing protein [Nitzschia inconspicua]|uniref:Fibronectin type III domain containing protein n=1 Tax=Nitzschia inconspicua TaxID=303405 RepID=A0A9K3LQK1_9STRA|nr:fibronectin type III domain containing protein [Nitzschia inconspicua]